jgi:hypothetical protein
VCDADVELSSRAGVAARRKCLPRQQSAEPWILQGQIVFYNKVSAGGSRAETTNRTDMMKLTRFRLQRGHWFSGVLLLMLAVGLYRPSVTENRPAVRQAYHQVTIYHVVGNSDDQWLEPIPGKLDAQTEPMAGALNLMAELSPDESPLPRGTRALSVVVKENGVAWADFNSALVTNFPGGSLRESLTINAVVEALAQFPGVQAVQFTVEGKIIDSIGGHVDISEPQPVPGDTAAQ